MELEKPLGEWNQMEITCQGDEITVRVNGVLVNHATQVSEQQVPSHYSRKGLPFNSGGFSCGRCGDRPATGAVWHPPVGRFFLLFLRELLFLCRRSVLP